MKEEKYIDIDSQELVKTTYSISGNIFYENKQGLPHRLDGPAIIYSSGKEEYWVNGKHVTKRDVDLLWLKKQVET